MSKSISAVASLFASIEAPMEAVITAFSSDLLTYVTSNNTTLLNLGLSKVLSNKRKALNRAYITALKAVMTVDEQSSTVKPLFNGFISKGKGDTFSNAPISEREGLLGVHSEIVEKFSIALNKAMEKKEISDEDKAKREKAKSEKKNKENQVLIDDYVKANNLVAEDRKLSIVAQCERVIDAIQADSLPPEYHQALKLIFKDILVKEGEVVLKSKTKTKKTPA
jgi:hypothetical protein